MPKQESTVIHQTPLVTVGLMDTQRNQEGMIVIELMIVLGVFYICLCQTEQYNSTRSKK